MSAVDVSFRIGGMAGQGVESSGAGFIQALTRGGLQALGVVDYYSRIRGGHNSFTIRTSDRPVYAVKDTFEFLLALNGETVSRHADRLVPGGVIVIDEQTEFDPALVAGRDVRVVSSPLSKIAKEHGIRLMRNTAILAVAAALVEFDLEHLLGVIESNFRAKGDKVVQMNRLVAQDAYAWTNEHTGAPVLWKVRAREAPRCVAINGSQAFAMGAIAGGCKFVAGYPMTPATSVLEYAAQHAAAWGLVVKHAEDEIAAVNMCVGAAHAGVRAMAPTSGGGFDLMSEGVSLAGITETPLVICLAQRPGPATGLATRTAQADLHLALHAGHGEFPRIILAPNKPDEAFNCAVRAFNLAEKYQCVVIVLMDQYSATSTWTLDVDAFDFESIQIDRGKLLSAENVEAMEEYKRYAITSDGVSPRALPGSSPKAVYLTTANEHSESGHITEEADISATMVSKRLRKLEAARADVRPPFRCGPERAELTFVSWGSSYGPVYEAMSAMNERGNSANMVHFVDLWPLTEAASEAFAAAKWIVAVEGNATGQFASLLRAHAAVDVDQMILRFDGRSFTPGYILDRIGAK